ncbi:hypothetical protein C0Q70_05417 [Pomacea canaliculata]|uniref:Ionotropic glutamate receptor L-glutamate and glycine-binding domain-containing protein n=1 Tax=Pomacea canaliculata TaxID=400727 RepID=A0A2T7PL77_POMCA|nr:hypothetical protein C0Q70_05417 [Pomacea canaliculata]
MVIAVTVSVEHKGHSLKTMVCRHLSRGDFAIFGVSNASSMATIQSYTNTFKVPFVTFSMAQNTSSNTSFQIYMRPIYVNALVAVISHYGWDKVYYIYDSDEGLIRLQQLFQAVNMHEKFLSIDAKRITTGVNCYDMIKELYKQSEKEMRRFVLDVHVDKAEQIILRVMRDTDINNSKFHFLLGDLSMLEMNLTNFRIGGMNITGFSMVNPNRESAQILMDKWEKLDPQQWPGAGTKSMSYEAALAVDAVQVFTRAFTSILDSDKTFLHEALTSGGNKVIKCTDESEVEFEGVTGTVAFDSTGHRRDFALDLYNVAMNRGTAKVGLWRQKTGELKVEKPRLFMNHAEAASVNKTQRVTTILSRPYVMYKSMANSDGRPPIAKENLEGFCIDLANEVSRKLHFDYHIQFVNDGNYGRELDNGTWNGMVES